jgi:hypothetical protein
MAEATPDEALRARICVAYLRSLRIVALRWLALASLPLCYQVATRSLPGTMSWLLDLTVATLALLAASYAVLEWRWRRRERAWAGRLGVR